DGHAHRPSVGAPGGVGVGTPQRAARTATAQREDRGPQRGAGGTRQGAAQASAPHGRTGVARGAAGGAGAGAGRGSQTRPRANKTSRDERPRRRPISPPRRGGAAGTGSASPGN